MALYFITGSKKKFEEVRGFIPDIQQLELDLAEIQELDAEKIIVQKLSEAATKHEGALMVEDTSLYFDACNGLPGPFIKWFVHTVGIRGLYTMAAAFGSFGAEAKTIIGYRSAEGAFRFFEGSVRGTIVAPRGPEAFGWDPIFQPEGSTKTFAEMTAEEKGAVSHRGAALRAMQEALASEV